MKTTKPCPACGQSNMCKFYEDRPCLLNLKEKLKPFLCEGCERLRDFEREMEEEEAEFFAYVDQVRKRA